MTRETEKYSFELFCKIPSFIDVGKLFHKFCYKILSPGVTYWYGKETLYQVCTKSWIPKSKNQVKGIIKKCLLCQRHEGKALVMCCHQIYHQYDLLRIFHSRIPVSTMLALYIVSAHSSSYNRLSSYIYVWRVRRKSFNAKEFVVRTYNQSWVLTTHGMMKAFWMRITQISIEYMNKI